MIGIDEVGRGCWAGPLLVVAARQVGDLPEGLDDSKVLSKKRRAALIPEIKKSCQLGEGWAEPAEIDLLGLTAAMRLAVKRALAAIGAHTSEPIIMDGNFNYCPVQFVSVACVIDADAVHPIVSAASIYAKQRRDDYMTQIAGTYPGYGFENHVGYGTKAHLLALQAQGICKQHRLSVKPVMAFV